MSLLIWADSELTNEQVRQRLAALSADQRKAVTGLYLNNNKLEGSLPDEVAQLLPNLSSLVVSDNALTALPASLASLRSLEYIHANSNALVRLAPELSVLPLKQLWLLGNKDLPVALQGDWDQDGAKAALAALAPH